MKEQLFEVSQFVSEIGLPVFSSYEEAEKGYVKHFNRKIARKFKDPLNVFSIRYSKLVSQYIIKRDSQGEDPEWWNRVCDWRETPSHYLFSHVVKFLKKHNYYGEQIFNSKGIAGDSMETVYHKDGVIIEYCGSYEYLEVFGLKDKDYQKLRKVHEDLYSGVYSESDE